MGAWNPSPTGLCQGLPGGSALGQGALPPQVTGSNILSHLAAWVYPDLCWGNPLDISGGAEAMKLLSTSFGSLCSTSQEATCLC
jgi:hypothetical protein